MKKKSQASKVFQKLLADFGGTNGSTVPQKWNFHAFVNFVAQILLKFLIINLKVVYLPYVILQMYNI